MIHIIWEFIVREDRVDEFRRAYAPGGDWHRLFSRYPGYRETTLLADGSHARRFLTVDVWDTRDVREAMRRDAAAEYARLDAAFADLTEVEREIGTFDVVAPGR